MTMPATEQALRRAADLFHEIGSAIAVEGLLVDVKNGIMAEKLREKLRSPDQLRRSAADGFVLCSRTFLVTSAADPVRKQGLTSTDLALTRGAELFHEIESALVAEQLASIIQRMQKAALDVPLTHVVNTPTPTELHFYHGACPDPSDRQRSSEQLRGLTAEGFELCVRALAGLGATDVTIHECGKSALGERPWSDGDE